MMGSVRGRVSWFTAFVVIHPLIAFPHYPAECAREVVARCVMRRLRVLLPRIRRRREMYGLPRNAVAREGLGWLGFGGGGGGGGALGDGGRCGFVDFKQDLVSTGSA
jgi:hypothetical protein